MTLPNAEKYVVYPRYVRPIECYAIMWTGDNLTDVMDVVPGLRYDGNGLYTPSGQLVPIGKYLVYFDVPFCGMTIMDEAGINEHFLRSSE